MSDRAKGSRIKLEVSAGGKKEEPERTSISGGRSPVRSRSRSHSHSHSHSRSPLPRRRSSASAKGFQRAVRIVVHYGEGLVPKDSNGYSDPYLLIGIGASRPVKTKVIKKSLSPQWNEVHVIPYDNVTDKVSIRCFDHDTFSSDDFMGEVATFEVGDLPWVVGMVPGVGDKEGVLGESRTTKQELSRKYKLYSEAKGDRGRDLGFIKLTMTREPYITTGNLHVRPVEFRPPVTESIRLTDACVRFKLGKKECESQVQAAKMFTVKWDKDEKHVLPILKEGLSLLVEVYSGKVMLGFREYGLAELAEGFANEFLPLTLTEHMFTPESAPLLKLDAHIPSYTKHDAAVTTMSEGLRCVRVFLLDREETWEYETWGIAGTFITVPLQQDSLAVWVKDVVVDKVCKKAESEEERNERRKVMKPFHLYATMSDGSGEEQIDPLSEVWRYTETPGRYTFSVRRPLQSGASKSTKKSKKKSKK